MFVFRLSSGTLENSKGTCLRGRVCAAHSLIEARLDLGDVDATSYRYS